MSSRSRIRMADVAAAAGVSQTTASFVLNNRDAGISPETQERVLRTAKEMGYRPHATARALATGRTRRIGIVLNEPASFSSHDTYFSEVLAGIFQGALRRNYDLLLHSARHSDWRSLCASVLSGAADGTLLIGRYGRDELTAALLASGAPVVCVSYHSAEPNCHAADCDNEEGAREAVRYLLNQGHRRIAWFSPDSSFSWGRERLAGARRALEEAGMSPESLLLYDWPEDSGGPDDWMAGALEFLRRHRPTALVSCEEARARRMVEVLPECGVRVPEDLSVISFNSTALSERSRPPLTSVWQPLQEIGAAATDMLIDLIENGATAERIRRFPMRLDVRASCRPPVCGEGAPALSRCTTPEGRS